MLAYIIRRLMIIPLILMGVTIRSLPFHCSRRMAELPVRHGHPQAPGALDAVVEKYGLNGPIPAQFWRWLVGQVDESGEVQGGVLRRTGVVPKLARLGMR
jgi:ABC-type dipeptide/oligopeptide/nickel transport system permease component